MQISATTQILLMIGLALEGALVLVLLFRRGWRRFPVFTAYVCLVLAENVAAYAFYRDFRLYLYLYLVGESITILLGLGVAYEIFRDIFSAHGALRRLAVTVFQICAVGLIMLALVVLYYHASFGASAFARALTVAEEAARLVELGALIFLFIFSGAFGLHWRQATFGIALGLGVFVATKLAVLTILPHASTGASNSVSAIVGVSFDVSLMIWIGYILAPERVAETTELPQQSQLEQWNQAILELIHQ